MKKISERDEGGRIAKGNNLLHGLSKAPIYDCWVAMKARCLNPKNPQFFNYGGRGISVCSDWLKFENFFLDMGDGIKNGKTLDRIDVNGSYEKGNCRWITIQEQQKNRRNNNKTTGVVFEPKRNKWRADITFKRVKRFLGRFSNEGEAIKVRRNAELTLWKCTI